MGQVKQQRAAEQIRQIMSELFLRELSDPRLSGLTVTQVKLDRELRHANIYVTALDPEVEEADVMSALSSANSFLRRELSQRTRLRVMPQLYFHWDMATRKAEYMNDLLDSLDIPPPEPEPAPPEVESESASIENPEAPDAAE